MTGRELLELAAKAAGYEGVVTEYPNGFAEMVLITCNRRGSNIWNPLHDDADALTLAVKLCLDIEIDDKWTIASYEKFVGVEYASMVSTPEEVTRHAIVRAAAEIGKAKP